MLAAAVGTLERVGGGIGTIFTNAAALVICGNETDEDSRQGEADGENIVLIGTPALAALGSSAVAEADILVSGRISIPIGNTAVSPEIIATSLASAVTRGLEDCDAIANGSFQGPGIGGDFKFNAPSGMSGNFVFHAHLFIAAGFEALVSGGGDVNPSPYNFISASVDASYLEAYSDQFGYDWRWSYDIPGEFLQGVTVGAVSRHVTFEMPIVDGQVVKFVVNTEGGVGSFSELGHEEWFASIFMSTAGAVWGYVTREGETGPARTLGDLG